MYLHLEDMENASDPLNFLFHLSHHKAYHLHQKQFQFHSQEKHKSYRVKFHPPPPPQYRNFLLQFARLVHLASPRVKQNFNVLVNSALNLIFWCWFFRVKFHPPILMENRSYARLAPCTLWTTYLFFVQGLQNL